MTNSSSFFDEINRGREGRNWGYSTGLPKLDNLTDGLTKGSYTLCFAQSGVAKSTFMLYAYVYNPLKEHLHDDKLNIILVALEMKKEFILAKLLSMHLFDTYHIRVSAKQLLSRQRNYVLPQDIYEKVLACKPWIDDICKVLTIYDKSVNADSLYKIMLSKLEKEGVFNGPEHTNYVPNNPDKTVLMIIDHLALIKSSDGRTKKQEIDRASSMMVSIRNRTNMSFLVIMQSNRAVSDMARKKQGFDEPIADDIKESGNPLEDCEICLALYDPTRDHKKSYLEWNIEALQGNCRSIICLKNRYGESNARDFCYFDGKVGWFSELPKPDEIFDYTYYNDPLWVFDTESKQVKDNDKNKYNFTI